MKYNYSFGIIISFFLALMLAACSADDSSMRPAVVKGRCAIVSRASADMQLSEQPNELINNWWVVFADATGTVRAIVNNSPNLDEPVDRDEFMIELPSSTYTLYAFGNITAEELYTHTGIRFIPGEKIEGDIQGAVWDNMANNPARTGLIPMSGTAVINFRDSETEFTVELIRMLAKVRLSIKNASESTLKINSLTFGLLNRGPVILLPDYVSLGGCPEILEEARSEKEELCFEPCVTVSAGETAHEVFYVRESAAMWTHPTQRYFVTFGIQRDNGDCTEEHYAITDALHWIHRNDFIDIPIIISDVTVDWSVMFYPPIGGYPAVVTEADGDSHFLTFGTAGKFRVRPEIVSNGNIVSPAGFSFEIMEIDGDSGIFSVLPAKDPVTGEIIGELSSKIGTASLTCAVTIDIAGQPIVRVRKLYIIRK